MNEYLEFAKQLAQDASEIALKYFSFETETTRKTDNTPLTNADTEINELIIKRINETYPYHSIYGEEKSDIKENSQYIWVCDPIDGTMAFSIGLPTFVFSIALVEQATGQPILGLINDPIMKQMYRASKYGGAYRNDKKIEVSDMDGVKYFALGGSGKKINFSNVPLRKKIIEKGYHAFKFPSFIYGAIQLANGKFAGGVFYNPDGHDVAALKIITEEAGGKVTDLNGEERRYDENGMGCIISNGVFHEELLSYVQSERV